MASVESAGVLNLPTEVPERKYVNLHFNKDVFHGGRDLGMQNTMFIRSTIPLTDWQSFRQAVIPFDVLHESTLSANVFSPTYNPNMEDPANSPWMFLRYFEADFPLKVPPADPGEANLDYAERWARQKMILSATQTESATETHDSLQQGTPVNGESSRQKGKARMQLERIGFHLYPTDGSSNQIRLNEEKNETHETRNTKETVEIISAEHPQIPISAVENSYNSAPDLERGGRAEMPGTSGRLLKDSLAKQMACAWLQETRRRRRRSNSKFWLPKWQKDLIVKRRDCRGFWMDLLCSVPAILYSIFGLIPVCVTTLHPKVQLGFQIANAVLLVVLSTMGLFQGRFREENRWYMRHYFLWTIVCHVVAFFFGLYSSIAADGSQVTQVMDISNMVQAVQTLPFWSVELFDIERLRVEKED